MDELTVNGAPDGGCPRQEHEDGSYGDRQHTATIVSGPHIYK